MRTVALIFMYKLFGDTVLSGSFEMVIFIIMVIAFVYAVVKDIAGIVRMLAYIPNINGDVDG